MRDEDAGRGSPAFDPTGSHPLPNASLEAPAPSHHGCGCEMAGPSGQDAMGSVLAIGVLLSMVRGRRRASAVSRARFWW